MSPAVGLRALFIFLGVAAVFAAPLATAFIPQDASVVEREAILKELEKQRRTPEQIEQAKRSSREERDRLVREALSGPPRHFEHFNAPHHPAAKRQAQRRLAEATEADAPPKQVRRRPALISSLVGIALFVAVLALHAVTVYRRQRVET